MRLAIRFMLVQSPQVGIRWDEMFRFRGIGIVVVPMRDPRGSASRPRVRIPRRTGRRTSKSTRIYVLPERSLWSRFKYRMKNLHRTWIPFVLIALVMAVLVYVYYAHGYYKENPGHGFPGRNETDDDETDETDDDD